MNVQQYWKDAQSNTLDLFDQQKQHRAKYQQTRDPDDLLPFSDTWDCVFITSLTNEDRMVTGGAVCEASLKLAGLRITDRTHRVSTLSEVKAFQKLQDENAARIGALESRRATRQAGPAVVVQPLQPRPAAGK